MYRAILAQPPELSRFSVFQLASTCRGGDVHRRGLRHWGGAGEDFGGVTRARRINALAVDRHLGLLGRRALRRDLAVPALAVHRAPRAEIETGHVIADLERDGRRADEVADDVMPGDAPHRTRVLAR